MLTGLRATTAENASLLNNFEIVMTAMIALVLFKEAISPRLWLGDRVRDGGLFAPVFRECGKLAIFAGLAVYSSSRLSSWR